MATRDRRIHLGKWGIYDLSIVSSQRHSRKEKKRMKARAKEAGIEFIIDQWLSRNQFPEEGTDGD